MSGPKGSSRNDLKVRVKTARGRRLSSTRWLERQLNDPYVREAKKLGYKSRAAFKLQEMDDKYGLLKPGMKVLDLGAAPGGWLQVAAQKVGSVGGDGRVLGIDLLEIEPIAGCETMQMDFL
ncbi:MAG TPA: 23S rRNA methyltransferase, partial [Alphaproteobacteria bacterium]|nr:23S rRNA methyltransferase [Alphaproteobacteria bacterium]